MKFSENWLRAWIETPANIQEWSEKLTAAGLEVEEILSIGAQLKNVVIGEVLEVTKHPNADRLNVCQVQIAPNSEALTIVCGASNVRAGLKVAVAQIGAVLPGDFKIKQSKIRGVESFGMLCSTTELGLGESATGIMELATTAPVGLPLGEYLNLPDHVLDINLTPNRGDCLSVNGLTRELHAITNWPLVAQSTQEIPATLTECLPIQIQLPTECPRYTGRIIKGIRTDVTTPLWLQEYLRRSGIRTIHPVVDVMNYVMLELGQPLHAFDLATIQTGIEVRQSVPGEATTLLDGQTLCLEKPALVIADKEKILALAGVMGSASSSVTATTTDIFIESAFFTPDAIRPTLRALHLHSDAAHRFERGVDPELPLRALHRATELVLSIGQGQAGPVIDKTHSPSLPKPKQIHLRASRIERILGIQLTIDEIETLLNRLNLVAERVKDGWQVTTPSYRFDLHIEIDLIEELARLYGYSNIPSKVLTGELKMQQLPETQLTTSRIRHYFSDNGYHETINYSFVDPKLADLIHPHHQTLALSNPISTDMSVMRTSLWPGLLQTALFNLNRQQSTIRFFEIGTCFFPQNDQLKQLPYLAGIVIGAATPTQWGAAKRSVDFFDIKGDLENLLALTDETAWAFIPAEHPALHPGQCASIQRAGQSIGYVGKIHPALQQQLDLSSPAYLFEISLNELLPAKLPSYLSPSKYPSIKRDLAFVVPETISYQQIQKAVREHAGNELQELQLFDIYQGTGIAPGQKSLALSLTFQLASRTLTDEDIDKAIQQIIAGLGEKFEATLRE